MTSWSEEIIGAFAEYFEVFTQSKFKAAMKSKSGLSVCVQGEKGDASKRGVQRASSDCKIPRFFLGSVPTPGEGVCGPTVCYKDSSL